MTRMEGFEGVDWKRSSSPTPPYGEAPLCIKLAREIVGTNENKGVDLAQHAGTHLSPTAFHAALEAADSDTVLLDVRNTYEHSIGWFEASAWATTIGGGAGVGADSGRGNGGAEQGAGGGGSRKAVKAFEPVMHSFTEFDSWAEEVAPALRGKKVLMYCTGGIRCEKASSMLKSRGVGDVNQLSGGIHQYLEQYAF